MKEWEKESKKESQEESKQEKQQTNEQENMTHTNEGYLVRVHFSQDGHSAADALKCYLKQSAQEGMDDL